MDRRGAGDLPVTMPTNMRAFGGRDDAGLERFLGALAPRLLTYAARRVRPTQDAADVVAQVLLTVWRRRDDLPGDDDQAAAWVFGVARNVLANHHRGQVRRQALADRLREDLAASAGAASTSGIHGAARPDHTDQAERVREALELLPEEDQELITLVVWDGFGVGQAGAVLGLAPSGARSRWARAKDRFAAALAGLG